MSAIVNIDGKPALRIRAKRLVKGTSASLYDCEGDQVWIPNSVHRWINEETIDCQEWFVKYKIDKL